MLRAARNCRLLAIGLAALVVGACGDDETGTGDGTGDVIDMDGSEGDAVEDTGMVDDTATEDDTALTDTTPPADTTLPVDTTVEDTTPSIPPADITASFGNCSAPGGDRNIYDIQDPQCPDHFNPQPVGTPGVYVEFANVIVTANFGDTMFIQEPNGGPYSGMTVFNNAVFAGELEVGDVINVTGNYSEFFENSQLYLETFELVSSGPAPTPYVIAHPAHVSTVGEVAELFEGVLIRVENVETINTRPDCPQEYGEFAVTGNLRIDDMGFFWDARLGDQFTSITGPLTYAFSNFKIEPRNEADLAWTVKGESGGISKCIATDCQAPETAAVTHQIVVNEMMPDPFGSDSNQEWVELHNPTSQPVDINGWQIRDCGTQAFTLTGPNMVIPPGGYFVVGMDNNPTTNGGIPVDLAYGQGFYLPNTVGAVLLYDGSAFDANLVDQTRYSSFEPWDSFYSGSSIERRSPTNDGTQPTSWEAGSSSFGVGDNEGTPGERNDAN